MRFDQLHVLHELRRVRAKGDELTTWPLKHHLSSNGGIDPHLRPALIALLGSEGWHGLRLVLKRRPGRVRTDAYIEDNIAAYQFYHELLAKPMTSEIAQRYAVAINAQPIQIQRPQKQTRYELKIASTFYLINTGGKTVRLRKGNRIPKKVALAIASKKFGQPEETMRKRLRRMDALHSGQ